MRQAHEERVSLYAAFRATRSESVETASSSLCPTATHHFPAPGDRGRERIPFLFNRRGGPEAARRTDRAVGFGINPESDLDSECDSESGFESESGSESGTGADAKCGVGIAASSASGASGASSRVRRLPPVLLHLDIDCFFAQVEQLDHPAYRGRPVIVGGRKTLLRPSTAQRVRTEDDPAESSSEAGNAPGFDAPEFDAPDSRSSIVGRGVVCTSSYEARAFGVRTAMPLAQALRLCPQAICVPGRFHRYAEVSEAVFGVVREFSPNVRMASLDEAYVDITGMERWTILRARGGNDDRALRDPWPSILARMLKAQILSRTGIVVSVGIGPNAFIAKVASGKSKPDGLLAVGAEEAGAFARSLRVDEVPGIGPATSARLRRFGYNTLADAAGVPRDDLVKDLGRLGAILWARARGRDGDGGAAAAEDGDEDRADRNGRARIVKPAPHETPQAAATTSDPAAELDHSRTTREAVTERRRRSISRESTFREDITDRPHLLSVLAYLTERACWTLRREGLRGGCVAVKIRFADFSTLTHDRSLAGEGLRAHQEPAGATDHDDEVFHAARALFDELLDRRRARSSTGRQHDMVADPIMRTNRAAEPVRLIGVRLGRLAERAHRQWRFGEVEAFERRTRVLRAADAIRERFGFAAVAIGPSVRLLDSESQERAGHATAKSGRDLQGNRCAIGR